MDPRRLFTFRAVAHERSFSRAARELSLSQPSVSNQVGGLERQLGTRLFERGPGGLRLTHEGEILLEHADAIAERFQLAESQLTAAARAQHTRLRIGALPTALAGFVPAAIARLLIEHPDTKVTFDEGTPPRFPPRPTGSGPSQPLTGTLHGRARTRSSSRPTSEDPSRRAQRRGLDRVPHRRGDRPRVPRRGLRAEPCVD